MKHFSAALALLLILTTSVRSQTRDDCAEFKRLVNQTYSFDAAKMSAQQAQTVEKNVDQFWKVVKSRRAEFLPCLRAEVSNPKANPLFRFDGSNLLVELDPSRDSKALQIRVYLAADLDIVGAQRWLSVLSNRGIEGFDVSRAAEHWLVDPKAHYTLPEHGDFEVGVGEGALFLYGSMNEAQATPALLRLLAQKDHPAREAALWLLTSQATPQAFQALREVDGKQFSPGAQQNLKEFRTHPHLITPRTKPKTTRAEFLRAFADIVKGDTRRFSALSRKFSDGERDAAAVLKPEDLPLLRKVRRRVLAGGTPHSIGFYNDFTAIIMTLTWKPELTRPKAATSPLT